MSESIETVYQRNRALEEEVKQLQITIRELEKTVEYSKRSFETLQEIHGPYSKTPIISEYLQKTDNGMSSNDNSMSSIATLSFDLDDHDSEFRFRECINAGRYKSALWDLNEWLRSEIKHGGRDELQPARDELFNVCERCGVDFWDE